jgi:nitrite reductase (NO-forming)
MVGTVVPQAPRSAPFGRGDDRRITFAGLLTAAGFLVLAVASFGLTAARGGGSIWPSLHLVLAGAAGTAVASVLPFFTAALAKVASAPASVRVGAIGLIAIGSLAVVVGVAWGEPRLAVLGGGAYLAGLMLTAAAAFLPLRSALGLRFSPVLLAYAVALAQVAIGVGLATAMVAGWSPVVDAWGMLKPAHAWLNVFGFLSVVVAATLIHLAPTVAGARIRSRRSGTIALIGLTGGAPLVALGFAAGWDAVARVGAVTEMAGSAALVIHAIAVWRDGGHWTTEAGWHRFATISLLVAPGWFLVATSIAAGQVIWYGAGPIAWSATAVAAPLVLGWIAQVLVGAWTQLVPAIGPGDQVAHAAQRRLLGRAATARLWAWNAGVTLLVFGSLDGSGALAAGGAIAVAAGLLVAICLLVASLALGSGRVGASLVSRT